MPEPVRFPAQIPYDASFWAIQVFSQMSNNDWTGAQVTYAAHKKDVDDSMGAVDYWRQQFIPGTPTGPTAPPAGDLVLLSPPQLVAYQTPWETRNPNQNYAIQVGRAGVISAVVGSGGDPVWGRVADEPWHGSAPYPDDGKTSYGVGAGGRLDIAVGQWFTFCHTAAGVQSMRLDLI
jgi:hypothetical protein